MNHHTAPALEDLASEFGIIVDDLFIPAGDMGMCNCEEAMAEIDGLCSPCYADRQEWLEFSYCDPFEFMDEYDETREWVDF